MTDHMLLPDQSSFAVQDMRDVTGKEALTTITTTDKLLWEVN